ncbi:MAG: hypothetical protein ABI873_05205 [Marmoricola sp.]
MRRPVVAKPAQVQALVLVLVLAISLGACGSARVDYCNAVTRDQTKLSEMINSSTLDSLITDLPLLTSLAGKAPPDLTDEWQSFINAIEGLRDALTSAGLKPADFTGGSMPDSVQGQERRNIIAAANTLTSAEVVSAANGIETQARDVCKVNLGL